MAPLADALPPIIDYRSRPAQHALRRAMRACELTSGVESQRRHFRPCSSSADDLIRSCTALRNDLRASSGSGRFGEMALLDPEPRVASATAREDTQLFCLPRQPFYELMADRPEVAHGIIRVLTGYVRARVRDVANLNARIQELEHTAPELGQPRAVGAQYGWEPSA